jgi:hypothetical protein
VFWRVLAGKTNNVTAPSKIPSSYMLKTMAAPYSREESHEDAPEDGVV